MPIACRNAMFAPPGLPRTPSRRRASAWAARVGLLLSALAGVAVAGDAPAWRYSTVAGADGVPLNVVEAGNPAAPAIVFVHGIGQSYLAWEEQLRSPLAASHHLVAFDLRGHGNSGKPDTRDAYADRRKWADDVQAVLRATTTSPALLVGWSYGTAVILDYVRHHGTAQLAGIAMVSADGGLSIDKPRPPLAGPMAEMLDAMHRRQEGPDLEGNVAAARELARLLTFKPMPDAWVERAAFVAMRVPAPVWGFLRSHPLANRDLRPQVDVPYLLALGRHDGGMPEAGARELVAALRSGSVVYFEQSGHTPFVEEAAAFNERLEAFASAAFAHAPIHQETSK
jgi:non-heme chloroperoxidase